MGLSPKRNLFPNRVKRGTITRGLNASKITYVRHNNHNSKTNLLDEDNKKAEHKKEININLIIFIFIIILLIIFR